MCVAGLNVATGSCHHRWYELIRPCKTGSNLSNCSNRLRLEGWERRNDSCPWCDGSDQFLHRSTHRLFGSTPPPDSPASSILPTEPNVVTRTDRSGSIPTLSSFNRRGSNSSIEQENAIRHREMNNRLHIYINQKPHKFLPSASKNYPTYENWNANSSNNTGDENSSSTNDSTTFGINRRSSMKMVRRGWRKSVQLTRGMFSP